jgi:hypothetical protein
VKLMLALTFSTPVHITTRALLLQSTDRSQQRKSRIFIQSVICHVVNN